MTQQGKTATAGHEAAARYLDLWEQFLRHLAAQGLRSEPPPRD
jgi:hypothetical protein